MIGNAVRSVARCYNRCNNVRNRINYQQVNIYGFIQFNHFAMANPAAKRMYQHIPVVVIKFSSRFLLSGLWESFFVRLGTGESERREKGLKEETDVDGNVRNVGRRGIGDRYLEHVAADGQSFQELLGSFPTRVVSERDFHLTLSMSSWSYDELTLKHLE